VRQSLEGESGAGAIVLPGLRLQIQGQAAGVASRQGTDKGYGAAVGGWGAGQQRDGLPRPFGLPDQRERDFSSACPEFAGSRGLL